MTQPFNTATALLQAKNYDGARRVISEILEDDPDNIRAWEILINIEKEEENWDLALSYCRQILAKFPDNAQFRFDEFLTLTRLRRLKEAKARFETFKTDFSDHHTLIKQMDASLKGLNGNLRQLNDTIREWHELLEAPGTSPSVKRGIGLSHSNLGDLFTAQQLMEDVAEYFPQDEQLMEALAITHFRLNHPARARKYAKILRNIAPNNRYGRYIQYLSYLLYFPLFFVINACFMVQYVARARLGIFKAMVIFVVLVLSTLQPVFVFSDIVAALTGLEILKVHVFWFIAFILLYMPLDKPKWFRNPLSSNKNVKLKDY